MQKKIIFGGKVILEDRVVEADVLIENNMIKEIGPNLNCEVTEKINAEGMYVSPGFIDIHTHGGAGHDYMEGTYEAFKRATDLHFAHGTTSIVPTTVATDLESTLMFLDNFKNIKSNESIKPRLLGVHLEGPYLAMNQKGAIPAQNIKNPDPEEYLTILEYSNDILRWTIAPELPGALDLGDELKKRGIGASIGHSDAIDADVYNASKHGFNSITHLYSMCSGVVRINCYRYAGVIESAFLCDDLYTEAICDGHHLPDTLINLIYKNKGSNRMVLVTDSMAAAGLGEGSFYLGNPKDKHQVLVKNGVGFMPDMSSFAGSVATSDQLLRTLIRIGYPIDVIVKMMSITPARLLKMDAKIGSISEGKLADIVLINKDYHIELAMCDGEVKYIANK